MAAKHHQTIAELYESEANDLVSLLRIFHHSRSRKKWNIQKRCSVQFQGRLNQQFFFIFI